MKRFFWAILAMLIPAICIGAGVGIYSWTALSGDIADDDLVGVTDTSDTTQSTNGSSKKATMAQLYDYTSKPKTLNLIADTSISAAQILANKFITNAGATVTIAITLPAVSYEISRAVVVESAQIIHISPPSGEAFDLSGTTLTADQSFAGPSTAGSKVVITRQRNAAGSWIWSADVVRGTWAGI